MILDNETLKKRLRYQGRQYGNGQVARGGNREPHMLEQAADRIDVLEREALYCKTDYDYLLTITEDKDGLHDWLRLRSSRVGALVGAETPNHRMSAHDELLKIHRILLAPGACPAIDGDDTLTIRLLKDLIIWHRHQRQMAFGPQIAAMQQSQSDNIVAGVPTYGPSTPPRLRKLGESLEEYRAAMGWSNETPNAELTGRAACGEGPR